MNLPFFKRFNKKVIPLYYLVLVLRDEKAQAVIFEEHDGQVKIIGQKEEHFSTSIDQISQEELLEKLDKAISYSESSLPENIQTQKTIFGVKDSWTENDQIKKEYLTKLKKTSSELGLVPIGFLVISQAISHLLQKEEGAPVSAILTEINKKSITVTLLRAGKSIETKSSEIHESIPFTVDTILKHFNIPEILPSRIIIFNGKEDFSQEFISHTWSKSLPFLHLPQITNLPEGFDAKAVLFGAATQMGFEVLERDVRREPNIEHEPAKEKVTNLEEKKLPINTEPELSEQENFLEEPTAYKNLGAENFGFTKDIDVASMPVPREEEFQEPIENSPAGEKGEQETIPQVDQEYDVAPELPRKINRLNNILTLLKNVSINFLSVVFAAIKKINLRKFSPSSFGKFGMVIPAIIITIIAIIGSYFLFLKGTIELTVDPIISEQTESVLFSTTKETDSGQNIIKGEFVTVSENGSVSTAATGKKDIGTQAKGTVTIFNSLTESKTLAQGTILKSPNGLEFTLDSAATIKAVASHSADETVTPEKTTVNVTADQLGKESNLPSGTKFTVDSFDTTDLVAKNDNPFSGGTKKEVTVVSKNDSSKLETDLIKQLEEIAKEDLQKELGSDKILLASFISSILSSKSLSAKVGDEASQVTLNGTIEYQGLSYNKDDLIEFSKSLVSKDVPSNQQVDYNNIKADVLDIKNKNDEEINASLNIKTLLLPKIDENKLTKDLKGKSFKAAENILYKVSQVANVKIKLSPDIPFLPKNLPSRDTNIKILIKING